MRTKTIQFYSHIIEVVYPEEAAWLGDNLYIQINTLSGNTPICFKITLSTLSDSNEMIYNSSVKKIVFDIKDNVKNLFDESSQQTNMGLKIEIIGDSLRPGETAEDSMIVIKGKTLPTKPHGSSNEILLYNPDELENVDIFLPFPSTGMINLNQISQDDLLESHDLSSIITTNGVYEICFEPANASTTPPVVSWISDQFISPYSSDIIFFAKDADISGTYEGNIWNKTSNTQKCITITYEEPCEDFPYFEIKYLNCDGCYRYLMGKLLEEDDSGKWIDYAYRKNEIKYLRDFYTAENNKILKVGFKDVPAGLEFNDIIYSSELYFRDYKGEWLPCILNNVSSLYRNQEEDIILELVVNKY